MGARRVEPVCLFLAGNTLRVFPLSPDVRELLQGVLQYTRRQHLVTYKQKMENGGRNILMKVINCFVVTKMQSRLALLTNAGYLPRIRRTLEAAGYPVEVQDLQPEATNRFEPDWAQLEDFEFRYKQREAIEAMVNNTRGRIWWATGAGKGWILPPFCLLMRHAKIAITTKYLSVLETNYNRLRARLPDVGIYHGARKRPGRRVMCYSAGCLNHAAKYFQPDIIIADEVHELATDRMFAAFAKFPAARMYGLSANDGDRFDGADFELEGVFGEVISELSYPEAQAHGMVSPIQVRWQRARFDNPVETVRGGVALWRWGIWRNTARNRLIAKVARDHNEDQVLIACQTLEHACFLKQLLPEFELCYSPNDAYEDRLEQYRNWGLLGRDEQLITAGKMRWLRARFESGKLRKVIATSVWNRGVSFDSLSVLVRADGTGDAISDTQLPGRLARLGEDKSYAILYDFTDEFDRRFDIRTGKAAIRRRNYAKKHWSQQFPDDCDQKGNAFLRRK